MVSLSRRFRGIGRGWDRGHLARPSLPCKIAVLCALALLLIHAREAAAQRDGAAPAGGDYGVTFLAYYRLAEPAFPAASLSRESFEAHLAELADGTYTVLPVMRAVRRLADGQTFGDRTIAITLDDAYRSAVSQIAPRLIELGIPFTLFVSPGMVGAGQDGDHADWPTLRALKAKAGALMTVGARAMDNRRLALLDAAEQRRQIAAAIDRIEAELGVTPRLFSWPYGQYTAALQELLTERGFIAAFGRQSGVAHNGDNALALPRFSMIGEFGGLDRFRLAAEALPLPVYDALPREPLVTKPNPALGFTVADFLAPAAGIACFAGGQGAVETTVLAGKRVEARLPSPLTPGSARLNCTLPERLAGEDRPRWRWYGRLLFYAPEAD